MGWDINDFNLTQVPNENMALRIRKVCLVCEPRESVPLGSKDAPTTDRFEAETGSPDPGEQVYERKWLTTALFLHVGRNARGNMRHPLG